MAKSAAARVRDLRKTQFGKFRVECSSAASLKKRGERNTYFYRIRPNTVTKRQVETVFRMS